jgi:tRNA(Arg) A34 adenosine deaminase TadA
MSGSPEKKFMMTAIIAAVLSKKQGDYAVGAALVKDGELIVGAGNRTHLDNDPTAHAEILVLRRGAELLGNKDLLNGCDLYVTLEPCPGCANFAYFGHIGNIIYGATQADLRAYSTNHGNERWKWRGVDLPIGEFMKTVPAPKPAIFPEFMRPFCLPLFHS